VPVDNLGSATLSAQAKMASDKNKPPGSKTHGGLVSAGGLGLQTSRLDAMSLSR